MGTQLDFPKEIGIERLESLLGELQPLAYRNFYVTIQLGFKLSKIGVIAGTRCVSTASFDPVYEGEAKFIVIFSNFMVQR